MQYVIVAGFWLAAVIVAPGVGTARAEDNAARGAPAVDQPLPTDRTTPAVTLPRQCICTMEYDPVCGRAPDGSEATFSNACRARCAGATVIRRGPC